MVPNPPDAANTPVLPPELARVVDAWDALPAPVKSAILALVDAAGGTDG